MYFTGHKQLLYLCEAVMFRSVTHIDQERAAHRHGCTTGPTRTGMVIQIKNEMNSQNNVSHFHVPISKTHGSWVLSVVYFCI